MLSLAGCMLVLAAGDAMAELNDNTALVQLQALPNDQNGMFSKEAIMTQAMDYAKQWLKKTIVQQTPYGLGRLIVNNKDGVRRCSDISSSVLCDFSQKAYNLTCGGWGGQNCLGPRAKCADIKVAGICNHAKTKVNMSCLGWGGQSCLEHGADASMILDEGICTKSEGLLGIRSLGWGGSECLTKETAICEKVTVPGICNDAAMRLGLDCLGWSGTTCFSRESAKCARISTRHICQQSL